MWTVVECMDRRPTSIPKEETSATEGPSAYIVLSKGYKQDGCCFRRSAGEEHVKDSASGVLLSCGLRGLFSLYDEGIEEGESKLNGGCYGY